MCELTDLCTFLRWENKPTVRKFEISLPSHAHDISSSPPAHGHYLLPNNSYKKTKSCRRTDFSSWDLCTVTFPWTRVRVDHQEFSLLCSNGWRWCHRDILVPHWPSSPVTCGSSAHLFDAFCRKVPLLLYLCLECAVLSFLCCCCSVWSCPSCKIGAVEPQHGRLGGGVGGTHTLLFFDFFFCFGLFSPRRLVVTARLTHFSCYQVICFETQGEK